MDKVARKISFNNDVYKFLRARKNILIYIMQPDNIYDDDYNDGKILVVMYFPDRNPKCAYEVIHILRTDCNNGYIEDENIASCNRMAKLIFNK